MPISPMAVQKDWMVAADDAQQHRVRAQLILMRVEAAGVDEEL